MADWDESQIICQWCGGTGTYQNASANPSGCPYCGGDGYISAGRVKIVELRAELDEISAYLVTLRTDLTTVLTAIWNKVKNLP